MHILCDLNEVQRFKSFQWTRICCALALSTVCRMLTSLISCIQWDGGRQSQVWSLCVKFLQNGGNPDVMILRGCTCKMGPTTFNLFTHQCKERTGFTLYGEICVSDGKASMPITCRTSSSCPPSAWLKCFLACLKHTQVCFSDFNNSKNSGISCS